MNKNSEGADDERGMCMFLHRNGGYICACKDLDIHVPPHEFQANMHFLDFLIKYSINHIS